jgi:TIR domain
MPRDRVFISYSHQDEAFLQEFQVHLKPWKDRELLEIWSDHQINTSQDWHQTIQAALQETAVAVLLISPDFLASDYIRQHELPDLLRAREEGELDLACLYVRDSGVDDDDAAFEVTLSTGETLSVKLTKYQGLNNPMDVVAAMSPSARDTLYRQAAAEIKALMTRRTPRVTRPPTGKRFELTVQLKLSGSYLTRTYVHHYGRIAPQQRSAWQWLATPDTGAALFDTLFESQAQCDKILQVLFASELARPIRYPVRVRIQTDAPLLAGLPWTDMTWEGNVLLHHGWTFELIGGSALPTTTPQFDDITLRAPCPVLMIAPSTAPDADVHHRALEERLKHAWPFYHEKPLWVRDWTALEQVWQRRRAGIVYYYGPAESDGTTLTLLLDGAQGDIDRRPVATLSQVWGAQPPQLLFCNFVGASVLAGTALGHLQLPLMISQSGVDARDARRAALAWLHALLEGDEDTDPVWALHQYGLPSAIAWGAYSTWRTRTANEPPTDKLAHLLLDRKTQRALGHTAVSELVRDGERRLCCVLAYGTEGNLVELFAEQLYEHLRRNAREVAQVRRLPLPLPTSTSFEVPQLEFEVRRQLGLSDRDALGTALAERKPRGPGRARPILLLDWGTRGATSANRLSIGALEAWLTFCCQHLAVLCPKDLRLVSCLTLEIDQEGHARLENAMQALRAEARFRDRTFRLELLPPLDQIEANDLADFLNSPGNSSCPDDLLPVMPELIVKATNGRFRETVELIEQAERTDWYELHDELRVKVAQPAGSAMKKDELL